MMRFSAILFNIVEQCNLRCRHCGFFRSERSGEMAETCLVRWAAQAIEYGIPQVIFTGGEPFTRPGLLRAGVSAVRSAGGKSGVFTNASWAAGVAEAVRVLEPLEGLSQLFVSTDLYHLESVPPERVRNAIEAALAVGIRNVVLCVSYTTEHDRSAVHGLFADLQDRSETSTCFKPLAFFNSASHAAPSSKAQTRPFPPWGATNFELIIFFPLWLYSCENI